MCGPKQATEYFIISVVVISGTFDLYMRLVHGNDATISSVLLESCQRWPFVAFMLGTLIGHALWSL